MGKKTEKRKALALVQGARSPAARQRADLEAGYRPITGSMRDLSAMTHSRMHEIAVHLATRNPLAGRIVKAQAEWMLGEGVTFTAEDPRADDLLRKYWAVNRMDLKLFPMVCELSIFGEDHAAAFVRPYSGLMHLGVLDPGWVSEIVPCPDNAEVAIGLVQRAHGNQPELRYRSILPREVEESLSPLALAERERFADGEVMSAAINKLRVATRGVSDLFALSDWLAGYEEMLFLYMQRDRALSMYTWDYEFQGMEQDEIDALLAEMGPPRPFSRFGHNEKVKRTLVGPDAGAAENTATAARLFRNHVLGGAGQPEHWYGGGGDVNRSTADSMDSSAVKTLTAKQTALKWLIRDRLLAQVEMGIRVGHLRDTPEVRQVEVQMPDLSTLDVSRVAAGFGQIIGGLAVGKQQGWVSDRVATRFISALGKHVQVEVDAEEMLEEAQAELGRDLADAAEGDFDRRLQERAKGKKKEKRRLAAAGR